MPGVTIGEGATVGAHSVVKTDVPDGETWFGVPAKRHEKWGRYYVHGEDCNSCRGVRVCGCGGGLNWGVKLGGSSPPGKICRVRALFYLAEQLLQSGLLTPPIPDSVVDVSAERFWKCRRIRW